jgi:hypothetical protein
MITPDAKIATAEDAARFKKTYEQMIDDFKRFCKERPAFTASCLLEPFLFARLATLSMAIEDLQLGEESRNDLQRKGAG